MILFEDDWDKYPGAIVDKTTTNRSFLDYSVWLKNRGVKNYKWPLALFDRDLQGQDPFNPTLSVELKVKFAFEFKINPWAYFRFISKPVHFQATPSSMPLLWLYFNHVNVYHTQTEHCDEDRRANFAVLFLDTYLNNIGNYSSRTATLTAGKKARSETLGALKVLKESLPSWTPGDRRDDLMNARELYNDSLDNSHRLVIGLRDSKSAANVMKGQSNDNLRILDANTIPNIDIVLPDMIISSIHARVRAQKEGRYYGNIFTTTSLKFAVPDFIPESDNFIKSVFSIGVPWSGSLLDLKEQKDLTTLYDGHCHIKI